MDFRKVFKSGFEKVRDYSLSLVSGVREDIYKIQAEDSFCRDIVYSSNKLEQYMTLSQEEKIDSIRRLGIISWTGGPIALRRAGNQISRLASIFPSESLEIKIEIIKAISQICCLNPPYQNFLRECGFLDQLIEVLKIDDEELVMLQKWIIYCLSCLVVENVDSQRHLIRVEGMSGIISKYQTESWYTWEKNEANFLLNLLFYQK